MDYSSIVEKINYHMQLNHSFVGKKLGPHHHTLAGIYLLERPAYLKLVWQRLVALALFIWGEKKDNFSTLLEHMVVKVRAQNRNTDIHRLTMGYILLNPSYAENTVS